MRGIYLWLCCAIMLGLSLGFADAATVIINGKTVAVPVMEAKGKAYGDFIALIALLGGKAVYNPATHTITITINGTSIGSLGTPELAGDEGALGKIYTLRKASPLYFSLISAEYTVRQVLIGERLIAPKEDEKLLVIHFTVQNCQKSDLMVRFDSLRFLAVDAMNVNHQAEQVWGDEMNHGNLGMHLKPAQKAAGYAVITLPAKGSAPKLMVQSNLDNDGPVLRFDLREKAVKLPAPFADPADATGATALLKVPWAVHAAYPYQDFTVSVEKFDFVTEPLGSNGQMKPNAKTGERFFLATLVVKNVGLHNAMLRFDTLKATLTSADGETFRAKGLVFASTPRDVGQNVEPGQELQVRIPFLVPKEMTPATLLLSQGGSRSYEYSIAP